MQAYTQLPPMTEAERAVFRQRLAQHILESQPANAPRARGAGWLALLFAACCFGALGYAMFAKPATAMSAAQTNQMANLVMMALGLFLVALYFMIRWVGHGRGSALGQLFMWVLVIAGGTVGSHYLLALAIHHLG